MDMTCQQAALLWDISPRRVQILCNQGRVPGARRVGRMWLIPEGAQRPLDARRSDATSACFYWPEILQLDGSLMSLSSTEEILQQPMEDVRKQLLLGEIAYLKGDYASARAYLQGITPDNPAYLCAISVATAAGAALGEGMALVSAHNTLQALHEAHRKSQETRLLIEMAEGLLYVSAFSFTRLAPWLLDGVLEGLPPAALPMAVYVRTRALLSLGRVEQAIGATETTLSLLPSRGSVVEGYLWIMLAQARLYTKNILAAKQALYRAMDIFLPKGFLSPIAEYVSQMMGLIEQCLQDRYPKQLPDVLKLYQDMSNRWRDAHNLLTDERLTTLLTRREYQVAVGIVTGMSNQQSADQLGISLSTLKGHLQAVYQKLQITSRKELRAYILPKETPSK